MLFYADGERWVDTCATLLRAEASVPRATEDVEAALRLLLVLGELVQGVLDHDLERAGEEPPPSFRALLLGLLHEAATLYVSKLKGRGVTTLVGLPRARALATTLPAKVLVRTPEGLAHYALMPELFVAAARRHEVTRQVRVLGIRTAGVVLGAIVAASIDAAPAHSVRPEGPPFERSIRASGELLAALRGSREADWLVVDEGPGLSGSSFLAAAALLQRCGVPAENVKFLPSHAGAPGAFAGDSGRVRWHGYAKIHVPFEEYFGGGALPFLRDESSFRWPERVFMNLSAGRWRELCYPPGAELPPVMRAQERRKYWFVEDRASMLAKFAGLGDYGRRKLGRALLLARRGFVPQVVGLRDGFLVSRWLEASPAAVFGRDRGSCLEFLGRYFSLLAAWRAPARDHGASPSSLLDMAEHNVERCLGAEARRVVGAQRQFARELDSRVEPVYTDGKLEPWEWLVHDGRVFKADALDHAQSHDLARAQPIEWDLAGARVELGLNDAELDELTLTVARRRRFRFDRRRLEFYTMMYLAFRAGWLELARAQEGDSAEIERLDRRRRLYESRLRAELERAAHA